MQPAMNRAQRRAKRKPVSTFNRSAGVKLFHTVMAKNMTDATNDEDDRALLIAPLGHLERLRTGHLDETGFVDLNESNCAAFCLARLMHQSAVDDETRNLLAPTQAIFETAAEALSTLGERKNATGRFVSRTDEINAIRESLDMYGQLIANAPRGYVCRALGEAAKMVSEKLAA